MILVLKCGVYTYFIFVCVFEITSFSLLVRAHQLLAFRNWKHGATT